MLTRNHLRCAVATLLAGAALAGSGAAIADELKDGFNNPPSEARPRVWWHWMNGNVSKDGIAKDLAWMKRSGIGGLQNFDADLQTPQIVDKRLVYMTPEWKDAFRFAASEAERLDLEMAIAASPGWSETGGPWVKPEDGLKKLVWSETIVEGGKRFSGKLPPPPEITGPYQSLPMAPGIDEMMSGKKAKPSPQHSADFAVLAVPAKAFIIPSVTSASVDGRPVDSAALSDNDMETGVTVPRGNARAPGILNVDFANAQTIRSATLYIPGAHMIFSGALVAPVLEASKDGKNWTKIADISPSNAAVTASFAPVTAAQFRLVLNPIDPTAGAMGSIGSSAPGTDGPDISAMIAGISSTWQIAHFSLSPEPRVDQSEAKAGFSLADDYYALPNPGDGATGPNPSATLNLTSKMKPDGSLDWTAPKGNWRVLRLGYSLLGTTNHPAPPEATGLEVDKFDGEAVRRYLEHYIGMYGDAAGADLLGKKGVRAILTDSIEVGAANWTPKMVDQFKKLRGYDPVPWMPALTGVLIGTREQSDKFLYDYRRTLADLMASEHYGTVAKVAHEHDLKVYGEALENGRPSLGDDMAMRAHADVPMAAMWTHSREDGPARSYIADIKGAASVAHLYGQNLVAAESMTSARQPWAYAPRDLKRIIDVEFVTGVNRPVIHTSVHQPRDDKFPGLSLMIFGQYFNRHESWAEMARPWVDYMSRTSYMLQQGRNVADVAYFFGEEAPLTALYGSKAIADAPFTSAYDFVNADALLNLLRNDGSDVIAPSGARYKLIYLGGTSRKMTLPVLKKLAALTEGGATIVGMAPEGNPGLSGDAGEYAALTAKLWPGSGDALVGKGRVIASRDVELSLRMLGSAPDFKVYGGAEDTDIPFVHRKLSDGDSWYLVNRKNRAEKFDAHFRVAGKSPEAWNPMTGKATALSYRIEGEETIVPMEMVPEGSTFVVFRKPASEKLLTLAPPAEMNAMDIRSPWHVTFQPGRGAPESIVMKTLAPLNENTDLGIKYFSGTASYTTRFDLPTSAKSGAPIWLDLGDVREIAEVRVNGKLAGTSWFAPDQIDIGALVKRGSNSLEVRVANLWVNRLIGDKQTGATQITFTAAPTYKPDAPLRPSGLIGPVQIKWEKK